MDEIQWAKSFMEMVAQIDEITDAETHNVLKGMLGLIDGLNDRINEMQNNDEGEDE